jgi:hypothetical protein
MAFTQLPTGGGVPNVDFITQTLAKLQPDSALQNYARMHKNDPYILSLATAESNRRKALRTAAQGQVGQQPTVVDQNIAGMATPVMTGSGGTLQTGYGGPVMTGMASGGLPEDQGIAQLPTPNMQRMADGGIAGYEDDEEGMATGGMGGMFNFAQQSEPVVRMSGGGAIGFASGGGGRTEVLRAVLKELNEPFQNYLNNEKTRKAVDQLVQERLDKTATTAKPTAATPTAATPTAAPTKEGALYKPAKAAGEAVKYGKGALKGIPYISGGIGAYQGMSDLKDAGGFYNDPNVSTFEKAKQAGLTTVKAGLPIAGAGIGSLFTPAGTFVGGLAGTAASEYLDLETDALKAWKKANPQATPEQAKKAAVALAPAYDGPKLNAAQAERAVTGQPTVTPVPEPKPDSNTGGVPDLLPGNFTPSKAPTIEDATALGDKFFNSKTRINEINRQVLQEQMDANTAKENSIEALKAFNKKQGPAFAEYEAALKKEELQDATDKEKSGLQALFKGFLAIAAGESPNAATNIAKGSMAGLEEYSGAMKEFKKSAKERNKEMNNILQARRAEERGEFDKVQMYEDRANTANQAAARYGLAAINDITNAGGKASSEIYSMLVSNRSRESIAAMGERAANARTNAQLNAKGQTERLVDRMLTDSKFDAKYREFASIGPDARGDQAIIAKYSGPQGQIALQMLEASGPEGKAQAEIIKQVIKQNTGSMLKPQTVASALP